MTALVGISNLAREPFGTDGVFPSKGGVFGADGVALQGGAERQHDQLLNIQGDAITHLAC